jgi:hypothetical protein
VGNQEFAVPLEYGTHVRARRIKMLCSVCDGLQNILRQHSPLKHSKCPACWGSGVDERRGPPEMIPGSKMGKVSVIQKMHARAGLPVPTIKQVLAARHQREDFF